MDVALRQFYIFRETSWHAFEIESVERMGGEERSGEVGEVVVILGEVCSSLSIGRGWRNCVVGKFSYLLTSY